MQVWIYSGSERDGMYVWVASEDGLDDVPVPVRRQLGRPALAMSIELTPDRKLSQEDAVTVLGNIERQGFHLQMPRDIELDLARVATRPASNPRD